MPVVQSFGSQTGQQANQQQGTQSGQQSGTSYTSALSPDLTAQENLGGIGNLTSLADIINSINQGAQQAANVGRLPGGAALQQRTSDVIGSELSGQLDPGVIALLQQQGAENGIGGGMGAGANATNAAYLKALGLTSQQEEQAGLSNLNLALAANPSAPLFNLSPFLVTPSTAGTLTQTTGQSSGANAGTSAGQQSGSQGSTTISDQPSGSAPASRGGDTGAAAPTPDNSWWNSLFPSTLTSSSSYTGGYPTYNPATGTFTNPATGAAIGETPGLGTTAGGTFDPTTGLPTSLGTDPTLTFINSLFGSPDTLSGLGAGAPSGGAYDFLTGGTVAPTSPASGYTYFGPNTSGTTTGPTDTGTGLIDLGGGFSMDPSGTVYDVSGSPVDTTGG